jgi:hypothetical protein
VRGSESVALRLDTGAIEEGTIKKKDTCLEGNGSRAATRREGEAGVGKVVLAPFSSLKEG